VNRPWTPSTGPTSATCPRDRGGHGTAERAHACVEEPASRNSGPS
jgi:hypothetical protein